MFLYIYLEPFFSVYHNKTPNLANCWFISMKLDDAFFQPGLGWSVWGSLDWTKTTGGLNWRIPDRMGLGRIAATLTCGL